MMTYCCSVPHASQYFIPYAYGSYKYVYTIDVYHTRMVYGTILHIPYTRMVYYYFIIIINALQYKIAMY